MSRMTVSDRNALERMAHSSDSHMRVGEGGRKALVVFMLIAIVALAALTWAAAQIFEWSNMFLLIDLVILTLAVAAFARPRREEEHHSVAAEPDRSEGWTPKGF